MDFERVEPGPFAALGVHNDFAGEFARSWIKLQCALLELESTVNRVQHIRQGVFDRRTLGIKAECRTLRGSRHTGEHQCRADQRESPPRPSPVV
jgi:hypothetical protein